MPRFRIPIALALAAWALASCARPQLEPPAPAPAVARSAPDQGVVMESATRIPPPDTGTKPAPPN